MDFFREAFNKSTFLSEHGIMSAKLRGANYHYTTVRNIMREEGWKSELRVLAYPCASLVFPRCEKMIPCYTTGFNVREHWDGLGLVGVINLGRFHSAWSSNVCAANTVQAEHAGR